MAYRGPSGPRGGYVFDKRGKIWPDIGCSVGNCDNHLLPADDIMGTGPWVSERRLYPPPVKRPPLLPARPLSSLRGYEDGSRPKTLSPAYAAAVEASSEAKRPPIVLIGFGLFVAWLATRRR